MALPLNPRHLQTCASLLAGMFLAGSLSTAAHAAKPRAKRSAAQPAAAASTAPAVLYASRGNEFAAAARAAAQATRAALNQAK